MFLDLKKYNVFVLLTLIVLVVVSCRKGGEPQPLFQTQEPSLEESVTSTEGGPSFKDGGGPVVGGDDGEDDDGVTVIGGDDGDEDDSGGVLVIGGDDGEDDDGGGVSVIGGDDGEDDDGGGDSGIKSGLPGTSGGSNNDGDGGLVGVKR